MKYKASLDTLAKIITWGTVILFLVLGYRSAVSLPVTQGDPAAIFVHICTLLLFTSIIIGCYLFAPQGYIVGAATLTIVRPVKGKRIKLADIKEIRTVTEGEMTWTMRTFGVGGLFGYYGKFYSSKIGRMTFYATQKKNRILIITSQGQNIIITPDDLNMIEKVKEILAAKS